MLAKKKILIFTATYNEKDNIEYLIRSINDNNSEVDIFVIDDQSPDHTYAKIKDLQKNFIIELNRNRVSLCFKVHRYIPSVPDSGPSLFCLHRARGLFVLF